jgi:hypothetical protein
MKRLGLILLSYVLVSVVCAQRSSIRWSEDLNSISKISTELEIMHIDETGFYIQEGHLALKRTWLLGGDFVTSGQMIKLDKNFQEVFKRSYDKELKGKFFQEFFILKGKILMIASSFSKNSPTTTMYMCQLDKKTGAMLGNWVTLTTMEKQEKSDKFQLKLGYNADSTRLVLVSTREGKGKNNYLIEEFGDDGRKIGKTVYLSNEFDPETFRLEDLIFTPEKKAILVGRVYNYQEGKKSKAKFLEFSHYNIRMYDQEGKQLLEFDTEIEGKWLNSAKVTAEKGKDLILTAFYSDSKKDKTIHGILIQRIDPITGKVIVSKQNKFDFSSLTDGSNDEAEEREGSSNKKKEDTKDDLTAAEKKENRQLQKLRDEAEEFSVKMNFTHHYYMEDGGFVFLAEKYFSRYYVTGGTNGGGLNGYSSPNYYMMYYHDDMMMCRVNPDCSISWLKVVPKRQMELVSLVDGSQARYYRDFNYFNKMIRPFYVGFGATIVKGHLMMYLNDNFRNDDVVGAAQKVRPYRVGQTGTFDEVKVNLETGALTRKPMFYNKDFNLLMPRLGVPFKNEFLVIGAETKPFKKQRLSIARIIIK